MNALRPWHILVLLVIVLLLFGARRLPELARSTGEALRIFKREMKDLTDDDAPGTTGTPPAAPGTQGGTAPQYPTTQYPTPQPPASQYPTPQPPAPQYPTTQYPQAPAPYYPDARQAQAQHPQTPYPQAQAPQYPDPLRPAGPSAGGADGQQPPVGGSSSTPRP